MYASNRVTNSIYVVKALQVGLGNTMHHWPILRNFFPEIWVIAYLSGPERYANYACLGWSQAKVWWRLVAVLTCKLIVKS